MKKNISAILSPTKAKVLGTLLIYTALFLSSLFKTALVLTFFPKATSSFSVASTETSQFLSKASYKVEKLGPTSNFNKSLLTLLFSSAFEFFVIYGAVSFAIYLSKK